MLIETNALLFNAESFHSTKTNKDYHRCGLLIEGAPTNLFLDDKPYAELVKQPFFNAVSVEHTPVKVVAKLELKFTDKGAQTYLREVKPLKEK